MWRLTSLTLIGAFAGAFCVLLVAPVEAELVLAVDFGTQDRAPDDIGFSSNRVQSGFQDFAVGPEDSNDGGDFFTVAPPTPSITRIYGPYTVTVADPHPASNGLFFVDSGTVNHELGPIAEDAVGSSGSELVLTIEGLLAGPYSMTSYHHLAGFPLGDYRIGEIVARSGSLSETLATLVPVSVGFSPQTVSSSTFQLTVQNNEPLVLVFTGFQGIEPDLNGFALTRIPEPSSIGLVSISAVLCALGTRNSQRKS